MAIPLNCKDKLYVHTRVPVTTHNAVSIVKVKKWQKLDHLGLERWFWTCEVVFPKAWDASDWCLTTVKKRPLGEGFPGLVVAILGTPNLN
jgi:hypothetical protein